MTDKEALRTKALMDTDPLGEKKRFGLFSQPISNAIGDDGAYKTRFHPREDEGKGKPITKPRNFQSGPCRTGVLKKSFFGELNSLATSHIQDEYIQVPKRLLYEQNKTFALGNKNENKYKPASGTGSNILHKPSYEYIQDKKPQLNPKRHRDSDGRVKAELRNPQTNPGSNVIKHYFKFPKHVVDPYYRAHQLQLEHQKKEKEKEGKEIFKPNNFSPKTFHTSRKVFGEDVELKEKSPKATKFNITEHENPWRRSSPNKHGLYGYFSPFPEYKQNPPREIKRRNSEDKKQIFKAMNIPLVRPTPSISFHPSNLRKTVNNSFSHRF